MLKRKVAGPRRRPTTSQDQRSGQLYCFPNLDSFCCVGLLLQAVFVLKRSRSLCSPLEFVVAAVLLPGRECRARTDERERGISYHFKGQRPGRLFCLPQSCWFGS